jgi:hypothetical protein
MHHDNRPPVTIRAMAYAWSELLAGLFLAGVGILIVVAIG